MKKKEKKTHTIVVRVDEGLFRSLKATLSLEGRSISDWVRQKIREAVGEW